MTPTATQPNVPATGTPSKPRPRRWRRFLVVIVLVGLLLYLVRAPILTALAQGLIRNDPPEATEVVAFAGATGPFVQVPLADLASMYHEGLAQRILLIEDRSARTVELGILPTLESIVRKELESRGVPPEAIEVRVLSSRREWDASRTLGQYLDENPTDRVTVLCDQLASRRGSMIDRQLWPAQQSRVRYRALRDERFDDTNWWQSLHGLTHVAGEYIALAFVAVRGEGAEAKRWDPQQFQQNLKNPS